MNNPMKKVAIVLATAGGAGFVPVAPGTAGSALALPMAWGAFQLGGIGAVGLLTILVGLIGWWSCVHAERHFGQHDSSHIVIDEVSGQLIAIVPFSATWPVLVVAFGFFRLFDSFKPFPAGWIDREVKSGLGVMADDWVAGVYAAGATGALVWSGIVDRVVALWAGG